MLSKRTFMINTEMLDRLMKPIINEDLGRLDEDRARRNLERVVKSSEVELLYKHYNDKFANNISYYIKKRDFTMVDAWLEIVNVTIKMYENLFKRQLPRYNVSTSSQTMSQILARTNKKYIADAFKGKRNHIQDYRDLIYLRDTLSSFVNSKGIYDPTNGRRNDPFVQRYDKKHLGIDWAQERNNYRDEQHSNHRVSDEQLMTGHFMRLNSTIKQLLMNNNNRDMQSEIVNLTKCRDIMARMAKGVKENKARFNQLYRFIFEEVVKSEDLKQQILPLLEGGEWPDRFNKATDKQQVITDINRLIELLQQWCKIVDAESLGQRVDTPQQPQQAQQPQSDKIKRIENEWRAFTYNKRLAKDYGLDFKRFALTRGTFSADGKNPGLMNGYEGPKKSGTLRSVSFTPADYDAWVAAKEQGNGVRSITDEIKNLTKGYDKKQIADIWKKTTGKEINIV